MRRRAVFLDVDGTLVGTGGRVPAGAVDAVRAARANGHLVFVCTGRSRAELWPDLVEIGFDGLVGASGAFAEVGGQAVAHHGIPDADLQDALAWFEGLGTPVMQQTDSVILAPAAVRDRLRAAVDAEFDLTPEEFARGAFGFLDRVRVDGDRTGLTVTKLVYLGCPLPIDKVRARFAGVFDVVPSSIEAFGPGCGEVTVAGLDKAAGLDAVVAHLGLDHADTIAIGDSWNDLEMLRHAAVGIAMGNAAPEVKAVADEVTAHVDEDGLRLAFVRHGLIEA
ncbi:MAG TPA: Cof-type HAD-IIB family hydrolase [Propionibacterium sp.]|nr:Cof-type HAD-IIB family hydrolase [Propionibacterium sp.]